MCLAHNIQERPSLTFTPHTFVLATYPVKNNGFLFISSFFGWELAGLKTNSSNV